MRNAQGALSVVRALRSDSSRATHFAASAVLACLVAVALLHPAPAMSAARHATVTKGVAEKETLSLLRKFPGWRQREASYLICRGGKISRSSWDCSVGWVYKGGCHQGHVRVDGEAIRNGKKSYRAKLLGRRSC